MEHTRQSLKSTDFRSFWASHSGYHSAAVAFLLFALGIAIFFSQFVYAHYPFPCSQEEKEKAEKINKAVDDSNPDLQGQIRQVAIEYGLMSSYTAFIAVDSSRRTEGDHGVTISVPAPVPDGVRYDTTVQN